ncbi:MAG TPA: hypothetical protein VE863_07800 [Pyrinomonadaceae bacterium]|nr:hypothetical protein [Pyrinomonadaceae bacterium]
MKSMINRLLIALLLVSLASAAAFAKSKKRTSVSFSMDTAVNGTLVKSGTYDVVFDEETGELSILKGSKVIATTGTRLEQREHKARSTETDTFVAGNETKLISITFGGSDQRVVVNQGTTQMGANK